MTFWTEIDEQLDTIANDKPDTFDGVRAILLDPAYVEIQKDIHLNGPRAFGPDAAFFAGSGGDRSLWAALWKAGWAEIWGEASYYHVAQHPITGEKLTYIEGDVMRGER